MLLFGGFEFGAFLGDDPDELADGGVPIGEEVGGLFGAGLAGVEFDEGFHLGDVLRAGDRQGDDHLGVDAGVEFPVHIIDEGGAAGHACAEVFAGLAEDGDGAVGHVFAAVVAHAFDDGGGAGVADGEALAGAAVGEEETAGGSVEAGVACNGVLRSLEFRGRGDAEDDFAGGHAFADVVVGLADEFEGDSVDEEGAEGLACGSVAGDVDGACGEVVVSVNLGDATGEAGADVAVGVDHIIGEGNGGAIREELDGLVDFRADGIGSVFR